MWRIIAITPEYSAHEAKRIPELLNATADVVHLRKPRASALDISRILDDIPKEYYARIVLHDHFHLATSYRLGGIHLNSRNTEAPSHFQGRISRSCHRIDQLSAACLDAEYVFLSPIFDSISKNGYVSNFTEQTLAKACEEGIINGKVIALGGVKPEHFNILQQYGFGGAAMTGSLFENMENIQFITHQTAEYSNAETAELALRSGIRWIQLRMKNHSEEEIRDEALKIKEMCQYYHATFIIDDHVFIAKDVEADGVHLGMHDMPVPEARNILGNRIIGGTANAMNDIRRLVAEGVDYLGVGPYRHTTTKANLSPILGLDGYQHLMTTCTAEHIHVPIFAIGGIMATDLPLLQKSGLFGVAISSAILQSGDPIAQGANFLATWNKYKK